MLRALAPPGTLLAAGLILLAWTWRKWPDPLIDFGRELYVPWRLTAGDVLYRDIAYLNGPLSPYLNACWFKLFGASLMTLAWCNLTLLTGFTLLLYRLLTRITTRSTATLALLVFLACFAFPQFVQIGNYNFVCPYSHDLTHGLMLTFLALACVAAYASRPRVWLIGAAGTLLGLVFLTKAEVLAAALCSIPLGIGAAFWAERSPPQRALQLMGLFLGTAAIPPLAAFGLLTSAMPVAQAFRGTLGTWPAIFESQAFASPFYRKWMGTLDPMASLEQLAVWTAGYAAAFGGAACLTLALRRPGALQRVTSTLLAAVVGTGVLIAAQGERGRWLAHVAQPLPVVMLLLAAGSLTALTRRRDQQPDRPALLVRWMWSLLAFGLLGKMILFAHIFNNGFALAMPAVLLSVVALLDWIPAFLAARGGHGALFRTLALTWIGLLVVCYLKLMGLHLDRKTYPVAVGADRFWADERGLAVHLAVQDLLRRTQPQDTLVMIPQGAMVNYLARRVNPTPFLVFDPFELGLYGEQRVAEALEAHPPDYVGLTHLDMTEHGTPFFGRDYGRLLWSWIQQGYKQERLIGAEPFQDERVGLLLLKRQAPSRAPLSR